jgi:hypothetical protein
MADKGKIKLELRARNSTGKHTYYPVKFAANGHVKPMAAMVDGKEKIFERGVLPSRDSRRWQEKLLTYDWVQMRQKPLRPFAVASYFKPMLKQVSR